MPIVTTKAGVELFYEDLRLGRPWEEPETVLLVHGSSENRTAWFDWLPAMATEFRVLVIDLPGFGRSPPAPGFDWSLEGLCDLLVGYLDAMGIERLHIVGGKVAGAITLRFASLYPERVKTLTVLAAPVRYPEFHSSPLEGDRRQWIQESQKYRLGNEVPEEQFAYWNEMMMSADPDSRTSVLKIAKTLDLEPFLPGINTPVLVITSDKGTAVPLDLVFRYYKKLPNARLLVIPSRAYHTAAAQPDQCIRNVIPFIKGELE